MAVISRPVSTSHTNPTLIQAGPATEIAGNLNRLTYRNLDELSNSLARGLRDMGVRKGDRVAVSLGNGWEFAVGSYAIWKLGGVLVSFSVVFFSAFVLLFCLSSFLWCAIGKCKSGIPGLKSQCFWVLRQSGVHLSKISGN